MILELAAARGISVIRGAASWRFLGPDVDVSVTELEYIEPKDLKPFRWIPQEHYRLKRLASSIPRRPDAIPGIVGRSR